MEGLGPLSREHILEILKAEVTAALTSIEIELITLPGCCFEQIAPSVHPRYVLSLFTACSIDQIW